MNIWKTILAVVSFLICAIVLGFGALLANAMVMKAGEGGNHFQVVFSIAMYAVPIAAVFGLIGWLFLRSAKAGHA